MQISLKSILKPDQQLLRNLMIGSFKSPTSLGQQPWMGHSIIIFNCWFFGTQYSHILASKFHSGLECFFLFWILLLILHSCLLDPNYSLQDWYLRPWDSGPNLPDLWQDGRTDRWYTVFPQLQDFHNLRVLGHGLLGIYDWACVHANEYIAGPGHVNMYVHITRLKY